MGAAKTGREILLMGLVAALGAGVLLAGTAPAQERSPTRQRDPAAEFALADFNNDGCVNWEELRNRSMIVFGGLDINGDGVITADELKHLVEDGTDVPPDTAVEMATLQAALRTSFEKEDADGSGCIDPSEWT